MRLPYSPFERTKYSQYLLVRNLRTKRVHIVESGFANDLWTECGYRAVEFPKYESFSVCKDKLDSNITCRTCRKVLELEPLPEKPKKIRWVSNYLGDTEPLGIFDDVEFEISVCREDYTEGRKSKGWPVRDLNKRDDSNPLKIILFDSDDYIIDTVEELQWMKQVAEALATGLNTKGLESCLQK